MHAAYPRRGAALLLLVVGLIGLSPMAFGQEDAASSGTAELTQDGWWNRAKGPQEGEADNPVRTNIGGSIPAPSTVPEKGLGVGAAAGDPDKVAAIGIILDAPPDALVDGLILTLRETPENGSNVNSGDAKIVACPITSFWAGVKNGDWVNRPTCDAGQSTPGKRAEDGTWTFDLGVLATQWVDPASGVDQNGVLLVEAVEAPVSFQTSFQDITSDKVTLDFSAMGGFSEDFGDETFTEETFEAEPALEEVPFDAGGFEPAFDDSAAGDFGSAGDLPVPTGSPQVATPASGIRPAVPIALFGNLPAGAVLFFVMLLLAGGLFVSLVLTPLTAAPATIARSGGVSRALAEREAQRAPR